MVREGPQLDAKIGAYGALPSAEPANNDGQHPPRRERLACLRPAHVAAGLVAIATCAFLAERAAQVPRAAARAAGVRLARAGLCHRGRRAGREVVASRLAKDGQHLVLILEAGGPYRGNPDFGGLGPRRDQGDGPDQKPRPTDVPRMWRRAAMDKRWPIG